MDNETRQRLDEERAARQETIRARLREAFPGERAITLEIGCGHGRWLTSYAAERPDRSCVGIDLISRRIRFGEDKQQRRDLTNLLFLKAECVEFLEALGSEWQLQDCFMLFPDPWPKKRHHKKRMVQDRFLSLLRSAMTADGKFFFRTDHADYFEWTQERVSGHVDWVLSPGDAWPHEHSSYFQDILPNFQSLVARQA